jgi:hypothetical protein
MTELSIFWETTSGTGDSNVSGYSDTLMFQALRSFFSRTANLGGVAADFQNELAVSGSASPLAVNTGAGMAYGIPYFNSASVSVVIPTPAASTRIDRIVLRASWAGKTVRITRIAGTEGAGAPALVQTAGTTWDIPLAQVSITTGAVITLTDQREWLIGIGDNIVDVTKLADNAVSNAKLADMAQNTLRGRITAGTGDPQDLTKAQALTLLNVADGADPTAATMAAAAAKATPVAADTFPLNDSAASNALKKVTLAQLLTVLNPSAQISGIWVPELYFAFTNTGITYTSRQGAWWKTGAILNFSAYILLSSKGAAAGDARIGGLPYDLVGAGGGEVSWGGMASTYFNILLVPQSGPYLQFRGIAAATANTETLPFLTNTAFTNTTILNIVGWYSA